MKKYILGLMICMSVMGTTTSFGKTNKSVVKFSPKTEVVCNQKKSNSCQCKTCKELKKKKQQECNCSNCKKQNTKHQVTQNIKHQTTTWRNTSKQSVRK